MENFKYYKLFFDMDEVLVNLSQHIVEGHYNRDFNDNMKWIDNQNYWWGDCKKASKSYFEDLLLKEGIFYESKPVDNSIEILIKLNNEGYDIHIITMPQFNSNYCFQEKIKWIEKHLTFIDINTHFHCTGNKGLLAQENRILIDDNLDNIISWKQQDGIGIAFGNFGWNKHWTGLKSNDFNELYCLINVLEDTKERDMNC